TPKSSRSHHGQVASFRWDPQAGPPPTDPSSSRFAWGRTGLALLYMYSPARSISLVAAALRRRLSIGPGEFEHAAAIVQRSPRIDRRILTKETGVVYQCEVLQPQSIAAANDR